MATFAFSIKCTGCGLHYKVFSWNPNWLSSAALGKNNPYCPECGQAKGMPLKREELKGEIYEHVSG